MTIDSRGSPVATLGAMDRQLPHLDAPGRRGSGVASDAAPNQVPKVSA
ncbi:MAG TPA: hypothetical protein VIV06_09415 [Candidatus Limnocylindrales bacterium]